MRVIGIYFFILLLNCTCSYAQTSLKELKLVYGNYAVGFKHDLLYDSSRTYKRVSDWDNQFRPRPIPISIWYPALRSQDTLPLLTVSHYMEILKEEEEWEYLPNEQLLNWFYYENNTQNHSHLTEKTNGHLDATPFESRFPTIIYAPSYQASSTENFALCEFLASHGFVVLSSPSRGTESRLMEGGTAKDMETQARDIMYLIQLALQSPQTDPSRIATMGFSFGGLSNVLAQMQNRYIKAIVSLDGSIKYQYNTLKKSSFASIDKVTVPFIHMAQKNIPKEVMLADHIDTTLNTSFEFYDSLRYSHAYRLKFNKLTHSYFSSMGVLFENRDPKQDKSDQEIMESYRWVATYTLQFLNAYLKQDAKGLAFLQTTPEGNGIPKELISMQLKEPEKATITFEDFHENAKANRYDQLNKLYQSIRKNHPTFEINEGQLNNLGLHLVYNPKTTMQGIHILSFATEIFPQSGNLFDSLAEAYLYAGDKEKAAVYFKKSLVLSPENEHAINRLKQLGK